MPGFFLILISVVLAAGLAVRAGKLGAAGAGLGCGLALAIYLGAGLVGLAALALFFSLATGATAWKRDRKEQLGVAERDRGRRRASQVLANGGAAGLLGLAAFLWPEQGEVLRIMLAAALASATSDTLSSELGTVYGRRFYDVLGGRKGERGADGVISLEGSMAGLAGSALVALLCALGWSAPLAGVFIFLSGLAGNLSDTLLGALLERKGKMRNDAVNFWSTVLAALTALIFRMLFV